MVLNRMCHYANIQSVVLGFKKKKIFLNVHIFMKTMPTPELFCLAVELGNQCKQTN